MKILIKFINTETQHSFSVTKEYLDQKELSQFINSELNLLKALTDSDHAAIY